MKGFLETAAARSAKCSSLLEIAMGIGLCLAPGSLARLRKRLRSFQRQGALKTKCRHGETPSTLRRDSQYVNPNGSLRFEEPMDVSAHAIRGEAIPLNPWRKPNHPIAIAMAHQLLTCAE
jgi:hypothetical protein